ncbi:hypothetical protein EYF80_041522 [Liparis tanakae]|uniref:Uncharacterized protein n=1 Tax=Liparis tanakae TaxID=230148 RepID=A0A4Z2G6T3_9TELE|nr:hypothetical protein EYF80_041522 [Liparis tanakae]
MSYSTSSSSSSTDLSMYLNARLGQRPSGGVGSLLVQFSEHRLGQLDRGARLVAVVMGRAVLLLLFAFVLPGLRGGFAAVGGRDIRPVLAASSQLAPSGSAVAPVAHASSAAARSGRRSVLRVAVLLRHHVDVLEDADAVEASLKLQLHHALRLGVRHRLSARGVRAVRAVGAARRVPPVPGSPAAVTPAAAVVRVPRPGQGRSRGPPLPLLLRHRLRGGRVVVVIVVEVVLDAAVALVDLAAGLHGALVRRLGGAQVVAERLHVKVQPHPANSRCWDRCCSRSHLEEKEEDHRDLISPETPAVCPLCVCYGAVT